MRFGILLSLFILFSTALYAEEMVTCKPQNVINEKVEIFHLFAMVKNDILGTIPRFCRPDSIKQLAEQTDPGEVALDNFVDKLKASGEGKDDTVKINMSSETQVDLVIFDTLKKLILKKMWNQTSDEKRYSLLFADECSGIGLNRLPIHKKTKEITAKDSAKEDLAYKQTLKMCMSSSFEELAPYISKDILAEALLNFKNVFPKSFPDIVQNLCGSLSETDELILKNDAYADYEFADRSDASVEDFSAWLKDLYTDFSKRDEIEKEKAKITEEAQKKESESSNSSEQFSQASGLTEEALIQQYYEKAYKDKQVAGEPEKPVPYTDSPGYLIAKSKSGKYYLKITPEAVKQVKDYNEKLAEMNKKAQEEQAKLYSKQISNQIEDLYKKGQVAGQPEKPVPVADMEGFFINKGEDGKYFYTINDELKNKFLTKLKAQKDAEKVQMDMMMKSQAMQLQLKTFYDKMHNSEDPENDKLIMDAYGNSGGYKVSKDENGVYSMDGTSNSFSMGFGSGYGSGYSEVIDQFSKGSSVIPLPGSGVVLVKNEKNEFSTLYYSEVTGKGNKGNPYGSGMMGSYPVYPTANTNSTQEIASATTADNGPLKKPHAVYFEAPLDDLIKTKFQNKTTDYSKLGKLSSDEVAELKSYTGNSYASLNSCLRQSNCTDSAKKKIENVTAALSKLKSDEWQSEKSKDDQQILFRGARLPQNILEKLQGDPKNFVLDNGFLSTSGDVNIAKGFAGISNSKKLPEGSILFIMKTKSCVGISTLSHYNAEDEFLCPPGMKFNVKKQNDNTYVLEEAQ